MDAHPIGLGRLTECGAARPAPGRPRPSSKPAAFSTECIVEAARIQHQFAGARAVEMQRGGAFQHLAVEVDVQIQFEMADANLVGAGPGVDIHSFHGRINRSHLLISETKGYREQVHLYAEPKRVLAVVCDLFFSVKLTDAAKRCGLALEFVKDPKDLLEKAQDKPSLIIFDLNFEACSR